MSFGTLPTDGVGIPIGSVYIPNIGFVALQGLITTNTDGSLNQSTGVVVGRGTVALYTLGSTTTSGSTQNSGDLVVGPFTEVLIAINTTTPQTGTSPTIQYFWESKGADNIYYVLWQSSVLTSATNTVITSVGTGMTNALSLGLTGRLRWAIGGTSTPTFTHSINVYAK